MIIEQKNYQKHGVVRSTLRYLLHSAQTLFVLMPFATWKWRHSLETHAWAKSQKKGVPLLTVKENGQIRCESCTLCVNLCPTSCITVRAERPPHPQTPQTPKEFSIALDRCTFCGLCEEICPFDAIQLSGETLKSGPEQDFTWGIPELAFRHSLNSGKGILAQR